MSDVDDLDLVEDAVDGVEDDDADFNEYVAAQEHQDAEREDDGEEIETPPDDRIQREPEEVDFEKMPSEDWDALMLEREGASDAEKEAVMRQRFEEKKAAEKRDAELAEFTDFMRDALEKQRAALAGVPTDAAEEEEPEGRAYGDLTDMTDQEIAQLAKDRIAMTLSDAELRARDIDPADVEYQDLAPMPEPEYPETEFSAMSSEAFASFLKERDAKREEAR